MARSLGCLAVCLCLALPISASELDREFSTQANLKGPVVSDVLDKTNDGLLSSNIDELQTSELDGETPTQAWGWRRGFRSVGINIGIGGFGYPSYRYGGFGYGGYRGYGGYGGYGVRYTSIGIGYGGFGYGGYGFGYGGFGGYGYPGWGYGYRHCYW